VLNELFSALGIKNAVASESSKPRALGRLGALGAVAAYLPGEMLQAAIATPEEAASVTRIIVTTAAWMVIYAVGYSLALVIGQNRYLHRPWLNHKEGLMAVAGGAIFGLISGGLAQAFFSIAVAVGQGNPIFVELARIIAWALFGTLIGFGMSFIIPNLGRLHGTLGGGAGGAVGAVGFIACTLLAGDAIGRFIGMAIVGFALGYAIGLVEEVSRAAWLQVSRGTSGRETVRVSLGAEPVCVGSNSQLCTVWAQGARAVALRFRFIDGNVICDDIANERQMVVAPGFQQQVENVTVAVCVAKAGSAPAGQSAATAGTGFSPPVPPPPAPLAPRPLPRAEGQRPLTNGQAPQAGGSGRAAPSSPSPANVARKPPPPPPPPPRHSR
jgi:hypothetical protein